MSGDAYDAMVALATDRDLPGLLADLRERLAATADGHGTAYVPAGLEQALERFLESYGPGRWREGTPSPSRYDRTP